MWQPLEHLLHFARIGRARSSVINPLQWTLVLLIFGLLAILLAHGSVWLLVFFTVLIGLVLALLVAAYIYFMLTNPDALRSETYALVNTLIEKRMVGDSLSGLREVVDILDGSDAKLLSAGPETKEEHHK